MNLPMGNKLLIYQLWSFLLIFNFLLYTGCNSTEEKTVSNDLSSNSNMIDGKEIIPSKYKTIYIHNIRNKTSESYISYRLKEKLKTLYLADGRLQIKTKKEDADIWLYASIEYYHKTPMHYDRFGRATEYRLGVAVTLKIQKNMKKILEDLDKKNEAISSQEDPILLPSRSITSFHMFSPIRFENERDAQEILLDSLAERIVYTSFNGWYTELKTQDELNYKKYKNQKSLLKNFKNREDIVIPKDVSKEERERLEKEYNDYYYKEE